MTNPASFDIALVGGGLQNALIALAVLAKRPSARIALFERESRLGGNHTWCFHAGDVPADIADAIAPLITYQWDGYLVRFPNLERELDEPYAGTTSERLASVTTERLEAAPNCAVFTGAEVSQVEPQRIRLADGREFTSELVIDARGPEAYVDPSGAGFQRFFGLEIRTAEPHGFERPILIDATIEQIGGFRFIYTLPLAKNKLLIEDTTFARTRDIDATALEASCRDYADSLGITIAEVIRRESGALPMPWEGQHERPKAPLRAGYQGGWFHPATGYSFPVAARLAAFIAGREPGDVLGPELDAMWGEQMRQVRFCHRLNRMLFAWFEEGDEWNVFERFYKLPTPLIRRFYALEMNRLDRTRLVVGRPPRGFSLRARLRNREASA